MNGQIKKISKTSLLLRIILPICLILAGAGGFSYLKSKEPRMKRKPPKKQALMVKTISLKPGNYQTSINAMGTVSPDREIILKSKVSGEVISISHNFVEGEVIKKGEILLELDDADYKIDVQKAQSALDKALSSLAIEKGSQLIAMEELKLLNEASKEKIKETDLALRKPQLIQAEAAVNSARADLKKAQLNMSRTKIITPFNALILEKSVNPGSLVNAQGAIATLIDIDAYKVEAQVPPDRLSALTINQAEGSKAVIYSLYSNQTWQGKVVRTTGKITDKSRMAGVIISVHDPLGLISNLQTGNKKQQLLINDYVDIRIMGETLENVFSISRSILRDDNTLWIYDSGVLKIKKIKIIWKEDGVIYIRKGISQNDKIISSDIPIAVEGMALQLSLGDNS